MIVLHYNTAFKALDTYVKTYNLTHKEMLSKQVRQSVTATAKELIRIYGVSLLKSNGVGTVDPENLPSLKTNNVQLAKLTHSSTRTIARHIKKLLEAGVLTSKIWHGSNASFEVWINPNILLVCEKMSQKKAQELLCKAFQEYDEKSRNEEVKKLKSTKCPHTETSNTSNTNNILIEVHKRVVPISKSPYWHKMRSMASDSEKKCELPPTGFVRTAGNITGNTGGNVTTQKNTGNIAGNITIGQQVDSVSKSPYSHRMKGLACDPEKKCELPPTGIFRTAGNTVRNVEKKNKGAGGNRRRCWADSKKMGDDTQMNDARSASLDLYVNMLWTLAKNVLYDGVYLTERQISGAFKLLRLWYEPVADHNLSKVHQIYVERIALARKFVAKDPENRFIQLPNRYFDPYNPSGFTGTRVWWNVQQKRNESVKKKLILHAQIRRFLNNEKKTDASKKPSLTMFRDCEQRIGKLGNTQLLELFHAAVINPVAKSNLN